MVDEKFRMALEAYCEEMGWEGEDAPLLLDNHAYDGSIVGITEGGSLVYSEDAMVEELMSDEGWTYEEAVEWLEYNTIRAVGYAKGGKPPILIPMTKESILETYGD